LLSLTIVLTGLLGDLALHLANSASAASLRRLCSSGVMSGTSPNLLRRGLPRLPKDWRA
jgi:hypothetical protein